MIRNTVSPSVSCSSRVSSSNAAAPIGSSPAVGSSRNSSSGSSASARARPARLRHAARQLRRVLARRVLGQAAHHHLVAGDLVPQLGLELGVELLERDLDVLGHGQRREQRAALEQHAPAAAHRRFLVGLGADGVLAEHSDLALVGDLQPDDRAHQHRLAGARAADHAEDLAAPDLERQVLVDHLLAEAVASAPRSRSGYSPSNCSTTSSRASSSTSSRSSSSSSSCGSSPSRSW